MKLSPFFWGIANRIVQQGLSFLNTIVLARFLLPKDFGTIGVLAIFINVSMILADTGMGGSIVKEKNLTPKDCSTVFCYNLFFSVFLYGILFFCAPLLEDYFGIVGLTSISRWATIPFVINAMTIVPRSLCTKRLEFNKIFYITLVATLSSMMVATSMAWMGYGVWALVSYNIVLSLVENIGYHIVGNYFPRIGFYLCSFKKLFSFGFLTSLSTIIDTVYENILSVIIGRHVGAIEVGYYTQAKKIEEAPTQSLSVTVSSVAFPLLCRLSDNQEQFFLKAREIQNVLMLVATPLMILFSLFSVPIVTFVLGNQWISAAPYLSILCFAGVFKILETTNRTFIKSEGRADVLFLLSLVKRTLGLGILFIAIIWGLKTLLWAYVFTSFLCALINSFALAKISSWSFWNQFLGWIKIAIPNVIYFFFLRYFLLCDLSFWGYLVLIVIATVLYLLIAKIIGFKEVLIMFHFGIH